MHPWHSVQMGAFRSLPPFAFFQKTISCFVIEFFMILHNTPGFWLLSLINQDEKRNCFEGQVCPLHNTKVCRMAVRRKTFPTNRSKLSPRSADDIKLGTLLGSTLLHARYGCISVPPVFLIFVWFYSFQMFLKEFRCVFGPSLSVVLIFLCFLFLADISAKVLACFPSLSFSLFLIFLCFCSLQMFLRKFGVLFVPRFLCVS